jgi:DNA (cytosine-5)-methyltransferase 1
VSLTYGEMFAGYGGLGMGVQSVLGGEMAWCAEFDKAPSKILAHHWPNVPNLGDVTKVDWATVEPVDIITGGFPCQDLSHAGKRKGLLHGERSNLFHEVIAAVAAIRPSLVVLENVRGLLSGKDTVDEPNDVCVCGWPYRRGGLHPDPAESGAELPSPADSGYDGEGSGGSPCADRAVRRPDQDGTGRHGEVGRSLLMDGGRPAMHGRAAGCAAAPDPEGRAGADRAAGRGDQAGSAAALPWDEECSADVDGRSADSVLDSQATDARVERQGADLFALEAAWGEEDCPACGGSLGDRPVRSVERSWMGTVLGALASIGYDSWWYGLRAADVGAAHGRFRVFVFAQPADADGSGLEGLADSAGTSPAERHGHAVAGAGGSAAEHVPGQLTLLPTPAVNDMGAGKTVDAWDAWTERMQAEHGNGNGHGKSLAIEAQRLLPTPVSDNSRGLPQPGTGYASLPNAVMSLLPTPTSADAKASGAYGYGGNEFCTLTDATGRQAQDWREYEAAIRRQEQTFGRPAPPPTEPAAKGQPRLSPRFVEWLMGLPEGHVTDVPGISRNDQLKALGNGVCPPQAAAATRAFLHDISKESAA